MTNNQLTPESVTRFTQYGVDMLEWPDGAYVKYEDYAALVEELQERRRAEMDSEPIVFTDERNLHYIAMGRETSLIWGKQNHEAGDIPLFRHPQPSVSEPWGYTSGILNPAVGMACVTPTRGKNQFPVYIDPQPEPVVQMVPEEPPEHLMPKGSSRDVTYRRGAAIQAWKQCRAAMLDTGNSPAHYGLRPEQIIGSPAQDGNSPLIPDGYVKLPGWFVKDAIAVYDRDEVEDALTAAGIKWEAE